VATTEWDQTEDTKADNEGVCLGASIHTEQTLTGGPEKPEERQQLELGRQLRSMPMPKPKPKLTAKLNPAPSP